MGLNKGTLEEAIFKALEESLKISVDINSETDNANQSKKAREQTAKDLALAIDTYVRAGIVTTTVATTGSAAAQTGTGTGYIS